MVKNTMRPCAMTMLLIMAIVVVIVSQVCVARVQGKCGKPPVMFNFGDSNSDTGGLTAGLGYVVNPPYGRSFFGKPSGRLSDGRLVIDFLSESLNTPFLSPYMESLGSKFPNGANFAVVGSATLPKYVPFALKIQVKQFLHFKARSLDLLAAGSEGAFSEEQFRNALYMIDIGQNDLADSFTKNLSYAEVVPRIPLFIAEIKQAVKTLYNEGGRKFWIHNTGPLGCLPQKLWQVQQKQDNFERLDTLGCISSYNSAATIFNTALLQLCHQMKTEMPDATIVHVDIFSIKYDIISNAAIYGITSPLMACCGAGGAPYNYNIKITCGNHGSLACKNSSQFASWDGIHYTEAVNAIVAQSILSMNYSTPNMSFDFFCHQ